MNSRRIRCSCGRVYDPDRYSECPSCGAARTTAAPTPPSRDEEKIETVIIPPIKEEGAKPTTKPTPLAGSPRKTIAIAGVSVLVLVIVFLIRGCAHRQPAPTPAPYPTPTPSLPTPPPAPSPSPPLKSKLYDQLQEGNRSTSGAGAGKSSGGTDLAALIEKTPPGATLKIPPGTYAGPLILTRPIHLVADAQASGQVTIQTTGSTCVSVQSTDVSATNIRFVCSGLQQLATIAVAEGAALQLDHCTVQSPTSFGVLLIGTGVLNADGSTFSASQGTAVRLDRSGQGTLSKCTIVESRYSFYAGAGSRLQLRSCALQRNGDSGRGILFSINGEGTEVTADDCQFESNTAGAVIGQKAAIKITNSRFTNNGPAQGAPKTVEGLLSVRFGARATLNDDTFENNRQGVYIGDGSTLEMNNCHLTGNGVPGQQLIPGSFPISVSGQGTVANIADTTVAGSPQYAAEVRGGARLTLDNVDFKDNQDVALIVGDRNSPPATAEIKRSHFHRNLTAIGIFGGSSATIRDSECLENREGILVFDKGSQVSAGATQFTGNTQIGLRAFNGAHATATDCTFTNNSIGVLSGTKNTPTERASITLNVCRFSSNRLFATGAAAQSELILRTCLFDGTDKLNVYKENGAIVQTQSGAMLPGNKPLEPPAR